MSARAAAPAAGRSVFSDHLARRSERDGEPAWLRKRRDSAAGAFETTGLPSPRDEDWRQTSVAPIAATAFVEPGPTTIAPGALDASPLAPASGPRAVLVDGRFSAELSRLGDLPSGITVSSLAESLASSPVVLEPWLARVAPHDGRAFTALNTALFADGVVVRAEPRTICAEPIEIVHVATGSAGPSVVHPRVIVVAGEASQIAVVETFLGLGDAVYLTNAVTEVVVEANAHVDHHRIQAESLQGFHVGALQGVQARDGRLTSHNVSFGARLARHDVGSRLDGEGAECQLYGLVVGDGTQHVDNHTSLDHAKPHCPSWEIYKTVLGGTATAVFNGRIVVHPDAQKTDAKQSNNNLLLSPDAVVHTRPQLEIYANDVKCTHGATIGRLDQDALFYLRSRGIARRAARDILVHAFAADVLGKIRHREIRSRIEAELSRRLPRASNATGPL